MQRKGGGEERGGKARKAEEAEGRGGQAQKGKGGREEQKASGCGNDAKRLFGLSSQFLQIIKNKF